MFRATSPKSNLKSVKESKIADVLISDFKSLIKNLHECEVRTSAQNEEQIQSYKQSLENTADPDISLEVINDILFDISKKNLLPDIKIINACITKLGALKFFDEAYALYCFAVAKDLTDIKTYSIMLQILGNSKSPILFALSVFHDAWSRRKEDALTYVFMLNAIANHHPTAHEMKLAELLFNEAVFTKKTNTLIYICMLQLIAVSASPDVDLAEDIFSQALLSNHAQMQTYSAMLEVISKSENPDVKLAELIFNEAYFNKSFGSPVYTNMLSIIAKSTYPNLNFAKRVFNEAEELKLRDTIMYGSMLQVISRSKKPDIELAKQIFNEAKSRKQIDIITYNHMFDIAKNAETLLDKQPKSYRNQSAMFPVVSRASIDI
ncbi:MAG TPA: hypothetical protein VHM20_08005, partial [Gammaproteobacteria bacterium]|nr:hypothetical protein [Gammaproteobacteria bacterium]